MLRVKNSRIICLILSFLIVFTIIASPALEITSYAFTPDGTVFSEGVYMVNLDTDICVYKKNELKALYPASTTKIMTCLVTLMNVSNLNDKVKVTYDATNEFWEKIESPEFTYNPNKFGPSTAAIDPGQDNLTYRDCLYALMLASACEAANILAYNVGGGSIENFIAMMNQMAQEIGCVNTHFGNAHGLYQSNNYSCAYDMYLITKYAYDNFELFNEITSTYSYDMPANGTNPTGYTITTTNQLMKNNAENPFYYEYASGIKTGSIDYYYEEGTWEKSVGAYNLVSTAKKDGFTYMLVTLGAPYFDAEENKTQASYKDALTLYKWAFITFTYQTILSTTDPMTSVDVEQGENSDHVILKPLSDYSTLLPKDLDASAIQKVITTETGVKAPVEKGQILGKVELKLNEETLTTIDLVASDSVQRSKTAELLEKIQGIVEQAWFRAIVAVLAVLVVLAIVLAAVRSVNRSKARKNSRNRRIRR